MNEEYLKFADENYLLHHVENPTTDSSENELLFTAEYLILNRDNLKMSMAEFTGASSTSHRDTARKYIADNMGTFYMNERSKDRHISHDNKTGMVAMYPDLNESIFKVGTRTWLHPRDWIFWGYKKYGWPFYPLLPIVSIANIYSCARTYKVYKDGRKELTTSGKMLSFVRNLSANLKLTQKVCTWLIKRNKHFGSWEAVGKIYFSAEGHPMPKLMKKELDNE